VLQYVAVCCSALQRRCSVLRVLQCVAVTACCSYSVLQCGAVCCSALQRRCSVLRVLQCVAVTVCCSVVQCVVVCCKAMQCVARIAVCCSVHLTLRVKSQQLYNLNKNKLWIHCNIFQTHCNTLQHPTLHCYPLCHTATKLPQSTGALPFPPCLM